MNAAAAISLAMELDCDVADIREGLQSFAGVDRRFSIRMTEPKILVDDYAHHPTEINAVYDALDAFYPNKRKLAIFQPHLFSRTRDFASSFKKALARFDELLLLDIYPARELPIAGVSSELLLSTKDSLGQLVTKVGLAQKVCESTAEIIVVMGAGDIAFEVDNLVQSLKKQQHA
jgi:UDP-N-acetylmuramate--alanine ligase